jgi:hypothetical protein
MSNLFASLAAQYIEEHRTAALPNDSDEALQWLEQQIEFDPESGTQDEQDLLDSYLALPNDELQALPGVVHEWFLERLALHNQKSVYTPEEIGYRVTEIFLSAGPGTYQATAIAVLLTLDERSDDRGLSNVTRIWDTVLHNWESPERRRGLLDPLVEALLDFALFNNEPRIVLAALKGILTRNHGRDYAEPLIRRRAEIVGTVAARPFVSLLDGDLDGRF